MCWSLLRNVLDGEPRVALDYAEIVDAETLEPVTRLHRSCYVLIAASCRFNAPRPHFGNQRRAPLVNTLRNSRTDSIALA